MDRHGALISPVLIGRDDLIALAGRRLDEARNGHGELLFLAGEAGIGKTRLLRSIERQASAAGFNVARGAAFPRDIEAAAGILLDLGRAMTRHPALGAPGAALSARLAAMDDAGPGDAHRRHRLLVLDAVDVLAGAAEAGPALLALEDLHWADDLTLEILAALCRRLPELNLLIVGTYRSDELYPRVPMREWRSRLLAGRLAEEARVRRLSVVETEAMASLILGTGLPAPADVVASIHERSDGVPLHIEELLGVVLAEADLRGDSVRTADVPDTLEDAVLSRAERLSETARRVADAAAVFGRSFDTGHLAEILDSSPDLLAAPLDELESRFFVTHGEPDRFDFRHALIRDALYDRVPGAVRRRLHGRVADAVADDARVGAAFLSAHLEEAGRTGDAFRVALDGGRTAAAMSAHREARELLDRAVRNAPAELPPRDRAAVLAELAAEAASTDDNDAAASGYEEARRLLLEIGDVLGAVALVRPLVEVRHLLGDGLAARSDRLRSALADLDRLPDDAATRTARARILAGLSAAHMLDRRLDESIAFGEASRTLAVDVGDEETELNVGATLGSDFVFAGRMAEGWALLETSVVHARDAGREAEAARTYRMIGSSASVVVEYAVAERWLEEGIAYAERTELWNHRHYMAAHLGHVRWAVGRWDDAERIAAHALADGRGGITTRITALHVLGYVRLCRGDRARADEALEEARGLGERMGELQRLSPALWGLAEAALLSGDHQASIRWCEAGRAASKACGDAAYLFPFLVTGTRAYLGAGDPGAAQAWLDDVAALLSHRAIPGTLPSIDHARGLLALAHGSTGRARTLLEAARAGWRERNRFWEREWAGLDLAACLARSNRPADARRAAEDVLAAAVELPSAPLEAEAGRQLARLGTRASTVEPWSPLTAREFEVARHIADGLTNAEIAAAMSVAPKTVTAHVEHILAKLGATRRTEVAAWAARVGSGGREGRLGQ